MASLIFDFLLPPAYKIQAILQCLDKITESLEVLFCKIFSKATEHSCKNEGGERGGHFSNAEGNWVAITFLNGTRLRVSDFRGKGINGRQLELLSKALSA